MIILMTTGYQTSILLKLDKIIDQNSKIIKLTHITHELITCLIIGYFTMKLTKYYFKTFNYFFFNSDPYKPYS
jgi:hypothetical protein